MSVIREISVEYSRTVNLGNFESERVQVGLTAAVTALEDANQVVDMLSVRAFSEVIAQLKKLERHRREEAGR